MSTKGGGRLTALTCGGLTKESASSRSSGKSPLRHPIFLGWCGAVTTGPKTPACIKRAIASPQGERNGGGRRTD
jgi:hypothetical protein